MRETRGITGSSTRFRTTNSNCSTLNPNAAFGRPPPNWPMNGPATPSSSPVAADVRRLILQLWKARAGSRPLLPPRKHLFPAAASTSAKWKTTPAAAWRSREEDNQGDPGKMATTATNLTEIPVAPRWSVNVINMNLFVTDTPLWHDRPSARPCASASVTIPSPPSPTTNPSATNGSSTMAAI